MKLKFLWLKNTWCGEILKQNIQSFYDLVKKVAAVLPEMNDSLF